MKRFRALFWFAPVAGAMFAVAGCSGDDGMEQPLDEQEYDMSVAEQNEIHAAWRVDVITGMDNDMLTEYYYDEAGRLLKKRVADILVEPHRTITRNWEDRYEWSEGRVSKKIHHTRYRDSFMGYDDESTSETLFEYTPEGWPLYDEGFVYDDLGRLVQTYSYEFEGITYKDRLEWDDRGNMVKRICPGPESSMIETPIPGTYKERVYEYEYDNHPKPNFGLGELFSYGYSCDPWPYTESPELPRSISRNNLTKADREEYRYTYNENGLPATVTSLFVENGSVITSSTLAISYKRIAE